MIEVIVAPLSVRADGEKTMHIREFTPDDYQAIVDIQNAVYPDHRAVVEDWAEGDAMRDPRCLMSRWVAEVDGKVVGVAHYVQYIWAYHPQHFDIMVRVLPQYQGSGIGSALYDHVIAALEPFNPVQFTAGTREDVPQGMRFLEQRGFALHIRDQRSAIVPAAFDLAPFAGAEARLAAEGITIKSYPELGDDPDRDRKLYDLEMSVLPDIPGHDDFTPPPFESWKKEVIDGPMLIKDIYLVAVAQDGDYAGMTCLWGDRASDMLFTGLTGVHRNYRRKGIATALKVRAITWAQGTGCSRINTDNAETNPMLQLNYALGFRPLPAFVSYKKKLNGTE